MSHSRNRRKKEKAARKKERESGPVYFKHPLSNIQREDLLKGLGEIGNSAEERFGSNIQKVSDLMHSVDALQTISTLAVYGLFVGVTGAGETRPLSQGRINQAHVELIQAVSLQIPEQQSRITPPNADSIQTLFDTLPELAEAFFASTAKASGRPGN
jgi:hypothetical protein